MSLYFGLTNESVAVNIAEFTRLGGRSQLYLVGMGGLIRVHSWNILEWPEDVFFDRINVK